MDKNKIERLKQDLEEKESRAQRESEHRQERIKVLRRELEDSPAEIKSLLQDELAHSLIELVGLQHFEIQYLSVFRQLVEQISKHFPVQWQQLKRSNTSAGFKDFCSYFEKLFPGVLGSESNLSPKQKYEVRRRRRKQCPGGVGLIEWEFGGARGASYRSDPLLQLTWPADLPMLLPTCLDSIFAGKTVGMQTLEGLLGRAFAERFPATHEHLSRIATEFVRSDAAWQNIGNSCRQALLEFCTECCAVLDIQLPCETKRGDVKTIARCLVQKLYSNGRFGDALTTLVASTWDYAQTLTHRPATTPDEALRLYLWTGLVINEIANLADAASK